MYRKMGGRGRPAVEALPFVSRVTGGGGGGRRDGVQAASESKRHVGWCEWRTGATPPYQLSVFYLPAVVALTTCPILGRSISERVFAARGIVCQSCSKENVDREKSCCF